MTEGFICDDCNKSIDVPMKCFVCKHYVCDDCWINNNHGRYDETYNDCILNREDKSKLIASLKSAKEVNGKLVKEDTSFNDIFDAFRLAMMYFPVKQE